jgi:hypothetical protein
MRGPLAAPVLTSVRRSFSSHLCASHLSSRETRELQATTQSSPEGLVRRPEPAPRSAVSGKWGRHFMAAKDLPLAALSRKASIRRLLPGRPPLLSLRE